MNGFLGSNMLTCHLKTNRDLGVLQHAEPTKTLKKNSRCDNVWSSSNNRRVGSIDWSFVERLRDAVRRKRPELWRSGEWLLHHDDAPAHTTLSVRQFLKKNGMTTASHPPPLLPGPDTLRFFSCFQEGKESFFRM